MVAKPATIIRRDRTSMNSIIPKSSLLNRRKAELAKRKNILPTLFLDACFWLLTFLVVVGTSPTLLWAKALFFAFLFISLFLLLSVLFAHTRRGLVVSFAIMFFVFLRMVGVGTIINLVLIAALSVVFEIYFSRDS